jgi:hypothetical protein
MASQGRFPGTYCSPTHSNLDSNNSSYQHYSSTLSNCLTTPTSSYHALDSNSGSGSTDSQDPTQQPSFQGFQQSCAQSSTPDGSGWYNTLQPQPGWQLLPFSLPPGLPQQSQQLHHGQQPQYVQQPQCTYLPQPDFAGLLAMLASSINSLVQTSIANQQAITTLLAEHTKLLNSIQHLNLSNQQTQQLLQHALAGAGGVASINTKVHTMEKLEKLDGICNDSACTFLVCFALWTQSLGVQMNRFNAGGNHLGLRNDQ